MHGKLSAQASSAPAEHQAARSPPAPLHPASAAPRHQSVHCCCPARSQGRHPHTDARATGFRAHRRAPVRGLLQRHQQLWQALKPRHPPRDSAARCRGTQTLAAPHQRAGGPAAALLSAPCRRSLDRAAAQVMQPPG